MKTLKLITITTFLVMTGLLTSCSKEGCMDRDSVNYDPNAKEDDGTCRYEGENVIWYGQNTSTELVNDGATTLYYKVDGQLVGSGAASVYWTGAPNCGQNGTITISKDLGGVKSKAFTYTVEDQTGWVYWSGVLNFTANTCEKIELTW